MPISFLREILLSHLCVHGVGVLTLMKWRRRWFGLVLSGASSFILHETTLHLAFFDGNDGVTSAVSTFTKLLSLPRMCLHLNNGARCWKGNNRDFYCFLLLFFFSSDVLLHCCSGDWNEAIVVIEDWNSLMKQIDERGWIDSSVWRRLKLDESVVIEDSVVGILIEWGWWGKMEARGWRSQGELRVEGQWYQGGVQCWWSRNGEKRLKVSENGEGRR